MVGGAGGFCVRFCLFHRCDDSMWAECWAVEWVSESRGRRKRMLEIEHTRYIVQGASTRTRHTESTFSCVFISIENKQTEINEQIDEQDAYKNLCGCDRKRM